MPEPKDPNRDDAIILEFKAHAANNNIFPPQFPTKYTFSPLYPLPFSIKIDSSTFPFWGFCINIYQKTRTNKQHPASKM